MHQAARIYLLLAFAAGILFFARHSALGQSNEPSQSDGESLFEQNCAVRHNNPATRAPSRGSLGAMSPAFIIEALTNGDYEVARFGPFGRAARFISGISERSESGRRDPDGRTLRVSAVAVFTRGIYVQRLGGERRKLEVSARARHKRGPAWATRT
jgi:hypothetical protein